MYVCAAQNGVLRTCDEGSDVRRKVGHETSYILWLSNALNWCARKNLKTPALSKPGSQTVLSVLTAASAFEPFPEALGAFNGATVEQFMLGEKRVSRRDILTKASVEYSGSICVHGDSVRSKLLS